MSGAFHLGAVLLAAGASRRMGRPKMLLPWNGNTILGHLIRQWKRAGASQIAVVFAAENAAVSSELTRLGFAQADRIVNPDPARGMFSSIRCAASWAGWRSEISHFAIVLGDQPHLRWETLQSVLHHARSHPNAIVQPSVDGRARHPVVLPREFFERLKEGSEQTLKQFLEAWTGHRELCELEDPGLDLDLDEPADYQKALTLFRSGGIVQ